MRQRKRKPRPTVQQVKIRQGVVHVSTDSLKYAEFQARALERDLSRYWVREQAEITPGVFALGSEAKQSLGVEVFQCPTT